MEPLEEKVTRLVQAEGLFAGARQILLAISGGADSIALLYVMEALRSKGRLEAGLICAHVNHQLRGTESDADATFVAQEAARLNLSVITTVVDVRAYAEERRLSLETAGREVRLATLAQTSRAHDCSWVATGHQGNDNAETVLQRLRRGTGFRGLGGIPPMRQLNDVKLARPLLCATRAEILAYLRQQNLKWRQDRTNADCRFTRNSIRHQLIPALQKNCRASLVKELSELAASARRLYDRVSRQAQCMLSELAEYASDAVEFDAAGLGAQVDLVAVELIRIALTFLGCGERDLTQHHYRGVLQLARWTSGPKRITLPGGFTAHRQYDKLILRRPPFSPGRREPIRGVELRIPGKTSFAGYDIEARVLERAEIAPQKITRDKGRFLEYFDWDCVGQPLFVRPRRQGDRFHPLGLVGEKKVGKFLTAAKVPETRRERLLIFDDGEEIIWVCPIRIGEQAKVTNETTRVLEVKVKDAREPGRT